MALELSQIEYSNLNSRQKENYNYQKVSAVLADYGFITHRLTDDWQGADFIAQHIDGETFLKVQLKGRLTFDKKYLEQKIFVAFRSANDKWFLYDHDELLKLIFNEVGSIESSKSWKENRSYSFPRLGSKYKKLLSSYQL